MEWERFDWLTDAALEEDAARSDVTTRALVADDVHVAAEMRAGAAGVVCALPLAQRVVARLDEGVLFERCFQEGDRVEPGQVVARLSGPAAPILSAERTMLNFVQRLSGVATLTAKFVERIRGTSASIYDTRKTTPGWRELEKYAVRCGGGCNHRMDLAAMALIKDNHLALMAGDTAAAVAEVRAASPDLEVELAIDNLSNLDAALAAAPDVIMLDNMTPDQVREAAALVQAKATGKPPLLEASGSMTLENVRDYAEAGADWISIGALTHSAPALDMSLALIV
ncbi:MAG: carboxylating nicotinate-nucleotide diphosphorylase [Planctomycetota bacterium]|jgi:nicotinate-nucleotide pyrophosphorylase (carboxylating)